MTVETNINVTPKLAEQTDSSLIGLYLGAFCYAFQDNAALTALTWLVMKLGGGSIAVGSVGTLQLGMYMIFCMITGSRIGNLSAKTLTRGVALITILILLVMPITPSVGLLLGLVALKGMVICVFWPPIMGWVSAGMNGERLNKRLGIFNLSWTSGAIAGCLAGGVLFSIAAWSAFIIPAIFSAMAVAALSFAANPKEDFSKAPALTDESNPFSEMEMKRLTVFRWISRLGLVVGWLVFGALRVPIASLLNELSLGAKVHSASAGGMMFVMMCFFYLLSRWQGWRYRFRMVIVAQLLLATVLVGVGESRNPYVLVSLICASAISLAFLYSSHLFYSVSGIGQRRSGAVMHEMLLSAGLSIGSLGAGALGQGLGSMRPVYIVIAGVVILTLLVQTGIYIIGLRKAK
jgi:MFS family permease